MDSIDKEHVWDGGTGYLSSPPARAQRAAWRERAMIWLCRIGIIAFVLSLPWGLSGCASVPETVAPIAEAPATPAVVLRVYVHEDGQTSIRLMPGPCVEPRSFMILFQAGPDFADRFKAIESTWPIRGGATAEYAGCWLELTREEAGGDEPLLILVFSDGHRGAIKKSEFLRGKGTGS